MKTALLVIVLFLNDDVTPDIMIMPTMTTMAECESSKALKAERAAAFFSSKFKVRSWGGYCGSFNAEERAMLKRSMIGID